MENTGIENAALILVGVMGLVFAYYVPITSWLNLLQ